MHDIGDIIFSDLKEPHASIFTEYLVHILLHYKTKYLQRECSKDLTDQILLFNPRESMERVEAISISMSPSMKTLDYPTDKYHTTHQVVKIVEVGIRMTEKSCPTATTEDLKNAVIFASKEIFVDMVSSTSVNDFFVYKMRTIYNYKTKTGTLQIYYYSLRFDEVRSSYNIEFNSSL